MENTIITGLFSIAGTLLGYYLATSRHAFEKVYDRKLDCLAGFYKEVVNLEFILRHYATFTGAEHTPESIDKKRQELVEIENKLHKFQFSFWENEIILDDSTAVAINQFLTKYIEAFSKLLMSARAQKQNQDNTAYEFWDRSYELVFTDLKGIKDELKEDFRKVITS